MFLVLQMRKETSTAREFCQKIGKVSEQSAKALKKLYPAFTSQSVKSGKRKFDPSGECVVSSEKRKKKATSIRIKPHSFIVFLPQKTVFVPKGYARQQLGRQGRVLKASFTRNMCVKEVKDTVVKTSSWIAFGF